MKNLKNRVMSGVMAGVLAASLAVPAFAANTTKVSGTYQDIPIAVTVPATGTVQINPYGLPVDVEKSDKSKVQIVGEQITSMPMALKNNGTVALSVGATVTGAIKKGSGVEFSATSNFDSKGVQLETVTSKKVFVYLDVVEAVSTDDELKKLTGAPAAIDDLVIDAFALSGDNSIWTTYALDKNNKEPANVIVVSEDGASKDDLATLAALESTDFNTDGTIKQYPVGSVAPFRLNGDCATKLEDDTWTSKDGFDVTIAFTFVPSV